MNKKSTRFRLQNLVYPILDKPGKKVAWLLVLIILSASSQVRSQVSTGYIWSQTQQTYTAGVSGNATPASIFTTSWDDDNYTAYTLPFNFTYNGVAYTTAAGAILGIDTDGWAAFSNGPFTMTGTTFGGSWVSATDHTGVYLNGSGNNKGFCGYNGDMVEQVFSTFTGKTTSGSPTITAISDFTNIRVGVRLSGTGIPDGTVVNSINVATQTITISANATATGTPSITPRSSIYSFTRGIAPYRQFVVQWTRTARYSVATGDDFSFQMVLNEGGGNPTYQTLQAVYGKVSSTLAAALNVQVGLRGNSAADFNARTTTTNWSATTTAAANTATCAVTPTVSPVSGLTFTWSPPCSVAASNAGALTGVLSVCPNTTQVYDLPGVPGAIFYTWTYTGTNTTYSGITTLPQNTLNFSSTATGGTLTVTPGNLCGNGTSTSIVITVASVTPATITYPGTSNYCISTVGTKSPTLTGPAGGTYSASPSGLSIVPATGVVTPNTSTAGTYTVTYTYTSGTCTSLIATTTVGIGAIPSVSVTATPTIVCSGGNSQLQAVGEAPGNYTVTSIAYTTLAPTETPTSIFDGETPYSGVDTVSAAIALPFNFNYYGLPITQLFVSDNGYIQLETGPDPSTNLTQAVPNPAIANNVIALAWADLVLDTIDNPGANVRYFVNGTTPNQVFVVEYTGMSFFNSPNNGIVSGQIRLFESDNHIEVALATVNDSGYAVVKTIGIENSLGSIGIAPAGRNGVLWNLAAPEAWSFKPGGVSYLWSPSTFITGQTTLQSPVATAVTANTTYNVKVTDASSGCFANATVSVSIGTPLSGVYTVGVAGNYATLTDAVYAYNNLCITGAITFSLIDATYPSETFPITINSNTYASTTKTLTIKPARNVTISGSNSRALLKLNGADFVIIDGSKTAGGITRDLTLTNTYTKKNASTVWLSSASGTNGATNDTVKNCVFAGQNINKTTYLLVSSGSSIGGVAAAANTKNAYQNNQFTKAQKAIVLVGPAGNESGNLISSNTIGSATAATKLGYAGIELYQQAGCKVLYNTIFGITTATFNTTSGISVFGTASGITIDANKISDVKNTNATGFGANGINLASTSAAANVTVTNNFIFDIAGKGYLLRGVADNGYGIIVDGGAGYFIDFNTVVLNTNQANTGYPAALNISSNVTTNNAVTIRNNILGNTQTQTGEHYTIQSSVGSGKIALIDYNDYYGTAGSALGYIGSNRMLLSDIVTGFGGNTHSVTIAPVYTSATDYHIVPASNPTLTNLGLPITGITTDYDTTTRNGLYPDMGADEWLMPNTGSWVGKTSIDWLTVTNWETNKVPDNTTDVTVTGGYTFMPTVVTTQAVRKLSLSAPKLPNVPLLTINGGTLQVYDTITRSGGSVANGFSQIDGSNGTLEMDGSMPQPIPDSLFVNYNLKNLVIANTNAATGVALKGRLDIYRSVTFTAAGKKLTTGDSLKFKSTATETAWLGNVTGKTIVGRATVERYIPTGINHGKSWQLLAVPVRGTQSVKASWQENNAPLAINITGYGTTIASDKPNANTARGYDFYTPTGGPSMKTWDPVTGTFISVDDGVTATSGINISNPKGYMVFVRGDRTVQTSAATATPTVLRTFGGLYTATVSETPPVATVPANKFITVGNPYPSAIKFTALLPTLSAGVDTAFYLWDPYLAGSYLLGGYQLISKTTGYKPTPGSSKYPANTPVTTIQSGQAFYLHAGTGGTLTFTEASKDTGSSLVQRPESPADRQFLRATLYKTSAMSLGCVDGNTVALDKSFSNAYDQQDALKMTHADENFGITSNDKILAVEARKPVTKNDTIFYYIKNLRQEAYQLRFAPENMSSYHLAAFLVDRFLNVMTPVSLLDSSFIDINITGDTNSFASNRFYLVFKRQAVLPVLFTHISAMRTSEKSISVDWKVENESGIEQYEIERSTEGSNFGKLSPALPLLNNGSTASYNHIDEAPLAGDNFYRIKALSRDGEVQYSAIVKVAPMNQGSSISVYPNPVANKTLSVSFINQAAGSYRLSLSNKMGQVVLNKTVLVKSGSFSESITLGNDVASGNYQLTIVAENGKKTIQQVMVN